MKNILVLVIGIMMSMSALAGGTNTTSGAGAKSDAGAVAIIESGKAVDMGRMVPDVYSPSMISSNICAIGMGAGVGIAGGGISIGGYHMDAACVLRMNSEHAHRTGQTYVGFEIMCTDSDYYAANKRAAANLPRGATMYICAPNEKEDEKIAKAASDSNSKVASGSNSKTTDMQWKWPDGS